MVDKYEYAASRVIYNPLTGSMIWKPKEETDRYAKRWNARFAGKECRTRSGDGYLEIYLKENGKIICRVSAHRLAWFIIYGKEPEDVIDHINQNIKDNRIENLRDVTKSTNSRNMRKSKANTSGASGVYWHKCAKKWAACSNRNKHLGLFDDIKDAEKAVKEFRAQHGFTEMHGC